MIACDEIINATDSVSRNVTNTIPTNMTDTISINVTSTVSTNSDNEKVRYKMDCYISHTFLLVIILLFTTAIVYYHYPKRRTKQKRICELTISKWGIINFKKFVLKIVRVIISMI